MSPVTSGPLSLHLQAPPQEHCSIQSTPGDWGRGEGLGPVGEGARGNALWRTVGRRPLPSSQPSPPEAAHTNPLQNSRYGLEVAAPCAKGAWVHPPTLNQGRDTLLQRHSSLKGTQNNSQTSRKVMLKMVSSTGESKQSGRP